MVIFGYNVANLKMHGFFPYTFVFIVYDFKANVTKYLVSCPSLA